MQFNSFIFIVFLACVCAVYFLLSQKLKPWFLLAVSLFFYAYWEPWAPILLALYALANFYIAKAMFKKEKSSLMWLIFGIGISVLLFILFRSAGVFASIFDMLTAGTGISIKIIFPIGFSYYMFKNISYLFDVYIRKVEPNATWRGVRNYLLYVAHFPELLMGPISRASDFLPQIESPKTFDIAAIKQSFILILIAFAKKLLIADRIAAMINPYIAEPSMTNGLSWGFIISAFYIQLYLDFSAYTDISIAISKILGYNIKPNFYAPFFALSISDYWRRWHMSLTSWLTDYIFKPLQFAIRNLGIFASVVAAIVTLIISGLWHGFTPNYFLYGVVMGCLIGLDALLAKTKKKVKKRTPIVVFNGVSWIVTFLFAGCLITFFAFAQTDDSLFALKKMLNPASYSPHTGLSLLFFATLLVGIGATIGSHMIELQKDGFLAGFFKIPIAIRYLIYLALVFSIMLFGIDQNDYIGGFIYAQF